jgi:hypothetical protein
MFFLKYILGDFFTNSSGHHAHNGQCHVKHFCSLTHMLFATDGIQGFALPQETNSEQNKTKVTSANPTNDPTNPMYQAVFQTLKRDLTE